MTDTLKNWEVLVSMIIVMVPLVTIPFASTIIEKIYRLLLAHLFLMAFIADILLRGVL